MKLATRMTLTSAVVAAIALVATAAALLHALSSELGEAELRATRAVAEDAAIRLQELLAGPTGRSALPNLAPESAEATLTLLRLTPGASLPPAWRPADDSRIDLVRRTVLLQRTSCGEIAPRGDELTACAVPLRDAGGTLIAVLEAERSERPALAAFASGRLHLIAHFAILFALALLFVHRLIRRGVEEPLAKLLTGVTEVAHGDLAAVLLADREDQIGALAGRFNEMTASLREAREETRRAALAQLALEARLRHSEKLAAIGQLAAEIAHEVGTPLNVIVGRASAMSRKAARAEEVGKNAEIIAEQATRITRIIQQLLDFARRRAPSRGDVDVAREVRDALDFLAHKLAASGIDAALTIGATTLSPPCDDPHSQRAVASEGLVVAGDRDQVQQVVLNLLVNAIQAMPDGGRLRVDVSRIVRRKQGLDLAPAAPYVVLTVSDTGVGIPPADRDRIFEPFFSTKADGEGTGLGLSVSHGIIKDHDGWIEIGSPAGGGTTFHVYLPAETDAAAGRGESAA